MIDERLMCKIDWAVDEAKQAYIFCPGSYTSHAYAAILQVQTRLIELSGLR